MPISFPLGRRGPNAGKYFALVDYKDYDVLNHLWSPQVDDYTVYAFRAVPNKPKPIGIGLHRQIMMFVLDRPLDKWEVVHHIDGDGLNNCRDNLLIASRSENGHSRRLHKNNTSGYTGVKWSAQRAKWQGRIFIQAQEIYLGSFVDPVDAAKAYDEAAKYLYGRFAKLNFPD